MVPTQLQQLAVQVDLVAVVAVVEQHKAQAAMEFFIFSTRMEQL
jgi:hypothetical protein